MSFASTHFVPFAMDMGFEQMAAANALGHGRRLRLVGGLTAGFLGDRFPRKNVLATVYLLRGLAFAVLLQAHDLPTLYFGSFLLGISWTSTGAADVGDHGRPLRPEAPRLDLRHDVHDHADRLGCRRVPGRR